MAPAPLSSELYSEVENPALALGFFGVFRYSRRALELVWSTSRAAEPGARRR